MLDFILILILCLLFTYINGFHDIPSIVSPAISSRMIDMKKILVIVAIFEFIGPLVLGTKIAKTIGYDIIHPKTITSLAIISGLFGAILWNLLTWYLGLPSSSSHALVGGMIGGVIFSGNIEFLKLKGLLIITFAIIFSPLMGLFFGYLVHKFLLFFSSFFTYSKINAVFKKMQIFTSSLLSLTHSTNDAQKTMGIITMAFLNYDYLSNFTVPVWVSVLCALSISLGALSGSLRIIRTIGRGIYKINPISAFSTQISSSAVLSLAAFFGAPVSTTYVLVSSISGVGSAERLKSVKWLKVIKFFTFWVITIPFSAFLSGIIYLLLDLLF